MQSLELLSWHSAKGARFLKFISCSWKINFIWHGDIWNPRILTLRSRARELTAALCPFCSYDITIDHPKSWDTWYKHCDITDLRSNSPYWGQCFQPGNNHTRPFKSVLLSSSRARILENVTSSLINSVRIIL